MNEKREKRRQEYLDSQGKHKVIVTPANPAYSQEIMERPELVGAYSRVWTMSEAQVESFELQKAYYEEFIAKHPNWTMVGMYADEGISATSMKKRKDFLRLIGDCKAGKVTLIVTKTVTRFARNAVDCIETCRMLKSLSPPVGVLFEADGIHTLSQSSELHLNLLAVLAQSESETKSTAIRWAFRKRFADGRPLLVDLYGYVRLKKELSVNPEEAAVVRMIFEWFLGGCGVGHIQRLLKERGIPSPTGKAEWSQSTIYYIITNEKYAGNVKMQKTVTTSLFPKVVRKNDNNIVPSYFIENYHEAIVSEEEWLAAQMLIFRRDWDDFFVGAMKNTKFGVVRAYRPKEIRTNWRSQQ